MPGLRALAACLTLAALGCSPGEPASRAPTGSERPTDPLAAAPGATWPAPAPTGETREYALVAAPAEVPLLDGRTMRVWAYNGQVPGPVLRAKVGDRMRVRVTNGLDQPTSVHWHGIRLANAMDGVPGVTQPPIAPGESFTYEFLARDAGTFWFHPHVRGSEQVERGLHGVLVVEDPADPPARELVWVLDDWRFGTDGEIDPRFVTRHDLAHDGRWGRTITVNGRVAPTFDVAPGERLRIRMIDVANGRVFVPRVVGAEARIIAFDGRPTARPLTLGRDFEMAPGNRADLEVVAPPVPGVVTVVDDFARGSPTLATLRVTGEPRRASAGPAFPVAASPDWSAALDREPDLRFALNVRQGGPYGLEWMLNGEPMRDHGDVSAHHGTGAKMALGSFVKMRFVNESWRLHPMHLHGQFFRVLARDGVPVDEGRWRDTVLVHPRETVDVGLVAEDPGRWALHCHVLEHHDSGMMTVVDVEGRGTMGSAFGLLLSGLSWALAGASPVKGAIDPPAAPGAMAPNLTAQGDEVRLTWLEPAGDGHRLRFAALKKAGWDEPRTIAEGDDLVANWADVPSVARVADGALVAHHSRHLGDGKHASEVRLSRSTDGGRTWRDLGPAHDDRTPTEHGFVSFVPSAGGLRVAWLDGRETPPGGPMTLRAARIDGDRVGPSEVIDARVCDCCGTAAATTAEGAIIAFRDRGEREVRDIAVARFVGGRWEAPRTVHADGWEMPGCPVNGPAIAADGRRVALAWFTGAGGASRVRVAFSEDAGTTFGAPVDVDGGAPLGRVGLVLLPGGDAVVSWIEILPARKAAVRLRRVAGDGRLGPPLTVAETSPDRKAGFPRLVRSGDDLVVAWTETSEPSRLRAARVPSASVSAVGKSPEVVAPTLPAPALPDYAAPASDGRAFSLGDALGSVVLVNVWATWCRPCRAELPVLARLHETHAPRGLRVVGVSVDEDAEALRRHLADAPLPYTVLRDPAGAPRAFRAMAVPATRLYDRSGRLVWSRDGAFSSGDPAFAAALEAALASSPR